MKLIFLILTFLLFFSCNRIENKKWKHQEGFSLGDWIEFDENRLFIRNDTIYTGDKPLARIYEYRNRILDQILVIEELNTTNKGYYCSKGKK